MFSIFSMFKNIKTQADILRENISLKIHKGLQGLNLSEHIEDTKSKTKRIVTEAEIEAQAQKLKNVLAERECEFDKRLASSRELRNEKSMFRQRMYKAIQQREKFQEKTQNKDKTHTQTHEHDFEH